MGELVGDDSGLRELVEELLGRARAGPAAVRALRCAPSPFTTLSPTAVLGVELEDGERLSLFLKELGAAGAGHPEKLRQDREIQVYEHVLGPEAVPAPRCYGARWNGRPSPAVLVLEYVEDWDLRYQALEHWATAAQALARLHRRFADRVEGWDFLLALDADYLYGWARRAAAALRADQPPLGRRLDALAADHGPVVALLAEQPPTLVHNDLAPKNVLADRRESPARICLVDWEVAGAGCGLLDFAHLAHGLDHREERRLLDAYRRELSGSGILPEAPQKLERLLAACQLHKTLHRLAHPYLWRSRPKLAERWVVEAERIRRRFDTGTDGL